MAVVVALASMAWWGCGGVSVLRGGEVTENRGEETPGLPLCGEKTEDSPAPAPPVATGEEVCSMGVFCWWDAGTGEEKVVEVP